MLGVNYLIILNCYETFWGGTVKIPNYKKDKRNIEVREKKKNTLVRVFTIAETKCQKKIFFN